MSLGWSVALQDLLESPSVDMAVYAYIALCIEQPCMPSFVCDSSEPNKM